MMKVHKLMLTALLASTMGLTTLASATTQTLTGVITDDMGGKKHPMIPGKPDSECIRACVKAGSHYALLVGDKLYALKDDAKQFDQLAGKKVKVSGEVSGMSIAVDSVAQAK